MLKSIFATLRHDNFFGIAIAPGNQCRKITEVMLAIAVVIHAPARLLQIVGKVPHGTEDQGNLLLVMFYISSFITQFGHHQSVLVWV